jgi:hypothetical protein
MTTQSLPPSKKFPDLFRLQTCLSLSAFRAERERAAHPQSLMNVQAPVGVLLIDIVDGLELDNRAKESILGPRLYQELRKRRSNHHR